jgi:hypothetical protein
MRFRWNSDLYRYESKEGQCQVIVEEALRGELSVQILWENLHIYVVSSRKGGLFTTVKCAKRAARREIKRLKRGLG